MVSLLSRLERNFIPEPNSGCWLWMLRLNGSGYGSLTIGSRLDGTRKVLGVHRVAYEIFKGAIPEGLEIDHNCQNKACVNPDHLEVVTHRHNILRGYQRNPKAHFSTCKRGHELTGANLYSYRYRGKEKRICLKCKHAMAAIKQLCAIALFLTLTWEDRSNNEQGFEIYRRAPGGSNYFLAGRVGPNVTRFRDQKPKWWEDYCYFIAAYNAEGRSETDEACNSNAGK